VSEGFSKVLEIEGVGYRASMEGKTLVLSLGFSHPVRYEVPEGVEVSVEKSEITISGIDREKVGQTAAEIRAFRKPEPYKGKGIHYRGEVIRRKVGKKAATAASA
jgi:large subunit ribosomal protein L6